MRIKAVMPDKAMDRPTLDDRERMLAPALSPGVELSVDCIKRGPDELDCHTDEAFAAAELVREAIKAEDDGYDAFVVYCFSDVALEAIRENVSIPVIGPGETSLAVANMLCNRFTVVTTESVNIPRTYRRLMKSAIAREKMATVRALDIPMDQLRTKPNVTEEYLEKTCREAVELDRSDGVVLGCLGMARFGKTLEADLGIKVLDPAFLSIAYAEMSVRLRLAHSRLIYPMFHNRAGCLGGEL